MDQKQKKLLNTSQRIKHVFACFGTTLHVTPGFRLLQSGDIEHCPECGAKVYDTTNTPLGQAYLAFARFDLGERP